MIVNKIKTEGTNYTTTLLAHKLHLGGHKVSYIGIEDLFYRPDGRMGGLAVQAEEKKFKTHKSYLENVKKRIKEKEMITAEEIDLLLLRNDPAEENKNRSWARVAGITFAQLAIDQGVLVLNDAGKLSHAINKIYFQQFPKEIQPNTLITRHKEQVLEFFKENGRSIIIKPLFGSGGRNVFQITGENINNLNQVIEAVSRDGYLVAQEFLPESEKGDTRLFLLNGEVLRYKGKIAALRRVNTGDDLRSNLHTGGEARPAEITPEMLHIAEMIKPKLIRDGMFFVGLDIIGHKLIEVNVFSPGGLFSAGKLNNIDFTIPIIRSLEQKMEYKKRYGRSISNCRLATM